MDPTVPTVPVSEPPDRSGALKAVGAIEVVMGGFAALMVPLILLGALIIRMSPQPNKPPAADIPLAAMVSAAAAAFLITMGIGTFRGRRWARDLMLVTSVIWLIAGSLGLANFIYLLPRMAKSMPRMQGPTPPNFAVIMAIVAVFLAFFYVALPAFFSLFYSRPSVRATCARLDPQPRWTERVPLPVLGLCVYLCVHSFGYVWLLAKHPPFPLFGRFVEGAPAILLYGLVGVGFWVLTVWLFQLQRAAWVSYIVYQLLVTATFVSTYAVRGVGEYYDHMQMPPQSRALLANSFLSHTGPMIALTVVLAAVPMIYAIFLGRYFQPSAPGAQTAAV